MRMFFLLTALLTVSSCKTGSYFPLSYIPVKYNSPPPTTDEDKRYLKKLIEKKNQNVADCHFLGRVAGKAGGGLAGLWNAKRNLKIEVAKKRADTVVFDPDPPWEFSETIVTGSYFKCEKDLIPPMVE